MNNNKVLAMVNGKEITQDIVMKFLNDLGPQTAMQFQSPEGIKKVVGELINQELLYLDAKANNFQDEQAFKDQLETLKEGLLKQYSINKVLSQIEVSEDEVKSFYEGNKENFKKPESILSSHILIDDEEKANEIIDEIREGKTFEQAAKEYSSCPSKDQGGNLGETTRGKLVPEFEDVAFSMEIGSVSQPVKTQFGYHIIKLQDKKESSDSTYDEVKDQIKRELLVKNQQEAYVAKTQDLRQKYEVKDNM